MESFSSTLKRDPNHITEDVTELDKLLNEKANIADEKELFLFVASLPEQWEKYNSKVEIYLRHKHIIGYTGMDFARATICYTVIKKHFKRSEQKKMERFLDPTDDYSDALPLFKMLNRVAFMNPSDTLLCMSLLNYIDENISYPEDEIAPEIAQVQSGLETVTISEVTSA
jgi:hypothetical protein